MPFRYSVSLTAMGAALAFATPAWAQQADPAAVPATTTAPDQASDPATSTAIKADVITGQPAPGEADRDIMVTGTRITRPNIASAAPITSVTAQDIKAQSPTNIEEVLNRLPQVAPDSQQNYQDSDGRQRIKLRSLGFERTLVLIDGKRVGTQNGQDTGIVPVSLIERVDVLTGGASSVYGSDAVAGVVNFIIKPDFKGIRVDGNYNFYNHQNRSNAVSQQAEKYGFPGNTGLVNDGGRTDVTLTAGTSLFEDRFKVSGFVNYKHADLIEYGSRSTSACQLTQTSKDGPLGCTVSTYSPFGYVSPLSGPNSGAAYVNNPNGGRNFVAYNPNPTETSPSNAANPYDGYSSQRAFTRVNAGGFASFKVAPEIELYGSALWFRDKSTNRVPTRVFAYNNYGTAPYQVNCNNPFLSASQATAVCGAAAGTGTLVPVDVRYRLNAPYLLDTYINTGIRATGGVRGKIGDAWTYDFGGVYARNQQDWMPSSLPNFGRVNNSLNVVNVNGTPTCVAATNGTDAGCVPFDAFSAGNSNQTLVKYLYGGVDPEKQRTVGILYNVQANVTGDLGKYGIKSPFADDGLAFAAGVEYREDRQFAVANDAFRADYGGSDSDLSQHVWEGNVEVQAPIVQHKRFAELLQVNGGVRLSKYNVNPSTFVTWKAEGLYSPVRDIVLRASFNKAQRAPSVVEAYQASNISFSRQGASGNDFCAPVSRQIADPANPGKTITTTAPIASREVCKATNLSDAQYGSALLLCPDSQCTVRSGGFTADPETAYTQTYGIILKPSFIKGLVFSVDRYAIKINNSLTYNSDSYYTDGCLRSNGDPFFCSGIVRAANGTLYSPLNSNATSGFIRAGTTNYYISIARGYDFQAQYAVGLGSVGRLDMSFNGSLTTFAGGQDSPVQPERNCAGYFDNGCGQLLPKWSHGLRTTYVTPDQSFNASFNWRYVGSLTSANNSGDPAIGGTPDRVQSTFARIAPVSYFDLALTFNIAKRYSLRFIANNLLDKAPPILPNSYGISLSRNNTIPARYDSLGRNLAVGFTANF